MSFILKSERIIAAKVQKIIIYSYELTVNIKNTVHTKYIFFLFCLLSWHRLERCKTREGANLEYLKNVIISYIVSKDPDGRRHMMNAISAVLQFTPAETQAINSALHKK